jgi:preprotein translocase subunit SecE
MGRILRKKPTSLKKKKRQDAETSQGGSAPAAGGITTAADRADQIETLSENLHRPEPKRAAASSASLPAGPPADNVFTRALQFLREVKIELKKVTWPTRQQAMGSTLVVIVLVMIISLFLGLVDLGLSTVVRAVFRT